jgi:hypothetical protein
MPEMKRALALAMILFGTSGSLVALQPAVAAASQDAASAVDPTLHENVLRLIALMGARDKMIEGQKKEMPAARAKLMESSPMITPQFADEWVTRMSSDTHIDEYIAAIAAVYEKNFNNYEIEEMIQIQQDSNDKRTPVVSDDLKAKLMKDGVTIQSEILGACAQLGAKLGGETSIQIGKEHPEWLKKAPSSDSDSKK